MHFFGCLFAILFGIIIICVFALGSVVNFFLSLLGLKHTPSRKKAYRFGDEYDPNNNNGQSSSGQRESAGRQNQKIFEKDDSEYVDFEEV